jgi:hypothetical protein
MDILSLIYSASFFESFIVFLALGVDHMSPKDVYLLGLGSSRVPRVEFLKFQS